MHFLRVYWAAAFMAPTTRSYPSLIPIVSLVWAGHCMTAISLGSWIDSKLYIYSPLDSPFPG